MNILYVTTSYPPALGGAQLHLHALASVLRKTGNEVRVVTQWSRYRTDWLTGSTFLSDPAGEYEHEGIPVSQIGFPLTTRLRMLPWALLYYPVMGSSVRRLSAYMTPFLEERAEMPELVHATRIGREFIVRAALNVARKRGIPFVLTPNHHPRWQGRLYHEYDKIYCEADALIALTESEKKTLIHEKGVDEARVHVTGIGPVLSDDYSAEGFREHYGVRERFVLFLGQLYSYKGVGAMLRAAPMVWQSHPDVRFIFAGPHTRDSAGLFKKYRDPRIAHVGPLSTEWKTSALAACELLCLPSSQESFGGVFVEAWAMGKAVIGGRIAPIADVIDDGRDGLLTSQEPHELAEKIGWLLSHPAEAAEMGSLGRRKVEERYNWARIAEATLRVYEQVRA